MKKQYRYKEDVYVECPYYKKENPTEIKCDGIVGVATTSSFRTKNEKEEHKYDFCNGVFKSCPVYQLVNEKIEIESTDKGG